MGWMIPVPVESTVPFGIAFERRSHSTASGKRRLSCLGFSRSR
jgi:hypothetical protein